MLDVLKKCLEKDPVQRITYEELICHPFWNIEVFKNDIEDMKKLYKIPSEPQFDAYLWNRCIDPIQYWLRKQGLSIPMQPQRLDILRLSYNVKRNMGSNNEYDKFDNNETNDVELKGDVELDFDDEKV